MACSTIVAKWIMIIRNIYTYRIFLTIKILRNQTTNNIIITMKRIYQNAPQSLWEKQSADGSLICARSEDFDCQLAKNLELYEDTDCGPTEFVARDSAFRCPPAAKASRLFCHAWLQSAWSLGQCRFQHSRRGYEFHRNYLQQRQSPAG